MWRIGAVAEVTSCRMPRSPSSRRAACAVLAAGALALSACGGDGDDGKRFGEDAGKGGGSEDPGKSGSAGSPRPFVKNFEHVTGVRLKPVTGDLFGTRLEVPAKPNRFERFGAYSLVWTRDDKKKELFLGRGGADSEGIHWRKVGTSWSASKPFGDRLVLRWVGRTEKETTPQWDRLERAVEAASKGTLGPLEPAERPCDDQGLDPLRGRTGACSVRGIPVTFVEAGDTLSVPALEAKVLAFGHADVLRNPGVAPLRAKGRFLIVAYTLKNRSSAPINFIHPDLRIGGRTVREFPDAVAMMPPSRPLPLAPGNSVRLRAAFDLDPGDDARGAALVLPAEREGKKDPSAVLSQGWIRLGKASPRLRIPEAGRSGGQAAGTTAG